MLMQEIRELNFERSQRANRAPSHYRINYQRSLHKETDKEKRFREVNEKDDENKN